LIADAEVDAKVDVVGFDTRQLEAVADARLCALGEVARVGEVGAVAAVDEDLRSRASKGEHTDSESILRTLQKRRLLEVGADVPGRLEIPWIELARLDLTQTAKDATP
jgi:hypothetical protein